MTLSSAEAEYFGAMMCAREAVFYRHILHFLDLLADAPTTINTDSKSAVAMGFDPVAFKETKHILRAAEFLRDLVIRGVFDLHHVPGVTMMADILTKPCARPIFLQLLRLIAQFAADGVAVPDGVIAASSALSDVCSVSSQEGLSERLVELYVCAYHVCVECGELPFWVDMH